jgi:hypothetical protein
MNAAVRVIELNLRNKTQIRIGDSWVVTRLPNGREVHAHPDGESLRMAKELGYGEDVAALTRDHDLLHSIICDTLGLPYSPALMKQAGEKGIDPLLVGLEEAAILAVQKFKRAWEVSQCPASS